MGPDIHEFGLGEHRSFEYAMPKTTRQAFIMLNRACWHLRNSSGMASLDARILLGQVNGLNTSEVDE